MSSNEFFVWEHLITCPCKVEGDPLLGKSGATQSRCDRMFACRSDRLKKMRTGRTYMSASWRDGHIAPGLVVIGSEEAMTAKGLETIRRVRKECEGHIEVARVQIV